MGLHETEKAGFLLVVDNSQNACVQCVKKIMPCCVCGSLSFTVVQALHCGNEIM